MDEGLYSKELLDGERARYYALGRADSCADGRFVMATLFVVAAASERATGKQKLEALYDRMFDEKYGYARKVGA